MPRPRILILGPATAAVSGVSTHLNLLLGSRLARDFTLRHFQVGSEGRRETALGRGWRLLTGPFALAARILAGRIDIVHLNTSLNRAFWRDLPYLLVARLLACRVVLQMHGGEPPAHFFARLPLPAALLRALLRLPEVIVVLACGEREFYRDFVPGQTVLRIANAIDPAPYATRPRPPAAPGQPLQLVFCGRLAPAKGLDEALEGLAQARAEGFAARLDIAGSGPEEARLRARVMALGLDDAVRFVGPVFGEAKFDLFAEADAQLLASHEEGLPYALLEGMAAGLPPITTRVGGIPDVVVEGVHGLFVPVGDSAAIARAIARLSADRELLAGMAAACRRRISHAYTLERLVADFAHVYAVLGAGQPLGVAEPF